MHTIIIYMNEAKYKDTTKYTFICALVSCKRTLKHSEIYVYYHLIINNKKTKKLIKSSSNINLHNKTSST